jgi:hypothetical protein
MKEMMSNGDLARMIADEVYTKPQVSTIAEDGSESEAFTVGQEFRNSDDEDSSDGDEVSGGFEHRETNEGEEVDADELRLHDMSVLEGEIVEASEPRA